MLSNIQHALMKIIKGLKRNMRIDFSLPLVILRRRIAMPMSARKMGSFHRKFSSSGAWGYGFIPAGAKEYSAGTGWKN